MSSNLIQLTGSALLKKIKVSADQLRLGSDTFSSIYGTFYFWENQMRILIWVTCHICSVCGPRKKFNS